MLAVPPEHLRRSCIDRVRPPRRRGHRARHVHRRRRAARARTATSPSLELRHRRSCTTAARSASMRGRRCPRRDASRAEPPDVRRRRRRRCSRCSPTRTSPPRQRVIRRYDHEIRGATVVRPLVGVDARRPRRRRGARRPGRHARHRHRHRREPVVRRCTTRSAWPTPWSTRRSATSSPSAPTPTRSRCSTTSRGATRAAPSTLGELVAAVQGCCDASRRPRRPVRQRQGLAEQRVPRQRRAAPRRAADAGDHRRSPTCPTPTRGHPRPQARPATSSCWSAARRASSAAATSPSVHPASRRSRPCPAPDADAPGPLPAAAPGAAHRAGRGLPRRQRGRPRRGRRRDGHRRPPRRAARHAARHADATVGAVQRDRPAASCARSPPTTSPGSAGRLVGEPVPRCIGDGHRPTTDVRALPGVASARRSTRLRRLAFQGAAAMSRPPRRRARRARHQPRPRRRRSPSTSPAPTPRIVLLAELIADRRRCSTTAQMLVVAGGFSYADALGAGRMFALRARPPRRRRSSRAFVAGRQAGDRHLQRLPGAHRAPACCPARSATTPSGHFECRWVAPRRQPPSRCVWTAGLDRDRLPDRPRRGPLRAPRSRPRSPPPARWRCATAGANPNGSVADIAGVCDARPAWCSA